MQLLTAWLQLEPSGKLTLIFLYSLFLFLRYHGEDDNQEGNTANIIYSTPIMLAHTGERAS